MFSVCAWSRGELRRNSTQDPGLLWRFSSRPEGTSRDAPLLLENWDPSSHRHLPTIQRLAPKPSTESRRRREHGYHPSSQAHVRQPGAWAPTPKDGNGSAGSGPGCLLPPAPTTAPSYQVQVPLLPCPYCSALAQNEGPRAHSY